MGAADAKTKQLKDRLDRSADLFAAAVEALSDSGTGISPEAAEALVRRAHAAAAELEAAESALTTEAMKTTGALDQEWRQVMEGEGESPRSSRVAALASRLGRRNETAGPPPAAERIIPQLGQANVLLDACLAQRKSIGGLFASLEASLGAAGVAAKADRRLLDAARQEKDDAGRRELELRDALGHAGDDEDRERLSLEHAEEAAAYSRTQQQTLSLERQVGADDSVLEAFEALARRANRHLSALDLAVALTKTEIERAVLLLAASSDEGLPTLEGHPAHAMALMRDELLSAQDVVARRQEAARAFAGRFRAEEPGAVIPEGDSTT